MRLTAADATASPGSSAAASTAEGQNGCIVSKRFNPPPRWPPVPPGWAPPAGWRPPPGLPPVPPGWPLWIDDDLPVAVRSAHRTWRAGRRLFIIAGMVLCLAALGLLAGVSGALIIGGLAAALAGLVGLIRPRWVGAPTRTATGITAGAGVALLLAGAAIAPPVGPTITPPPVAPLSASPDQSNPTTFSRPAPPSASPQATPVPTVRTTTRSRPRGGPTTSPTHSTGQGPTAGTALAGLADLTVKGRGPRTGYSRDQFGTGWATRPDGCSTRQTVLRRDLANVKLLAADVCIVLGGRLNDPYTGAAITAKTTSVDDLEADHVVPLSDAWQKGAAHFADGRREVFANDLLNLQTTIGAVNASKGDGDAATWLPPSIRYRCPYVAQQIAVKTKYELSVTQAEKAAMTRVLTRCPRQRLPTAASARKVVDRNPTLVTMKPEPSPKTPPKTDPRFPTCKAANAAGYGNYRRGRDPEYDWYRDNDRDGTVCER